MEMKFSGEDDQKDTAKKSTNVDSGM